MERIQTDRESRQQTDMQSYISHLKSQHLTSVYSLMRVDEYSRYEPTVEIELTHGESRGYWKYHAPGKWLKQAKAVGKINNEEAALLFDSGAEVSIIDTTFARKVGCVIDETQRGMCGNW